ncbi:MAG: hypothetical protein J1F06_07245 [Prevotellaceae bacterium]|nr:hypothetical protein [Prevotellaceae bacterium]
MKRFVPTLHVFNPWHDEALASGSPLYCPSLVAQHWAARMERLPFLWAGAEDAVLLADGRLLGANGPLPAGNVCIGRVCPWGWDALLCRKLAKAGLDGRLLPDEAVIAGIRALSHRRHAARLLEKLRADTPIYIGRAREVRTMDEIDSLLHRWGPLVLKAPWSGSGRGVWKLLPDAPETFRSRAERVIRLQGSLMAEPLYDRQQDFGMEFEVRADGTVAYCGLSLFSATSGGEYTGSWLLPDEEMARRIAGTTPKTLTTLARRLERLLQESLQGRYAGPLGVDMMIVACGGELRLHPAVEINLRLTMGHVAARFLARFPETSGRRLTPEEMLNHAESRARSAKFS